MTDREAGHDLLKGTAEAVSAVDRRSDQPVSALSDDEPNISDTTSILHGTAAISGKAAWSAGRMAIAADTIALYEHAKQVRKEHEEQEARELANLAEWNSKKIIVGGVEMTNAEAQNARQRIIDNGDAYADWAVQQGHIGANDKDAFKEAARRKKELEDKRGRGTMTPAEEREAAALDASRVGRALDATTAQAHRYQGLGNEANVTRSTANEGLIQAKPEALVSSNVFQDYVTSTVPVMVNTPSPPLSQKVKATGLDL